MVPMVPPSLAVVEHIENIFPLGFGMTNLAINVVIVGLVFLKTRS